METNVTRESVLALIQEKEKIENEISQTKSVLVCVSIATFQQLMSSSIQL